MCGMARPRLLLLVALLAAVPSVAHAHSYSDPALSTVFDGVGPIPLPAGVTVGVRPSVVDELVVSNRTATPLEVLAIGGEPFLRISSAGVLANLASPDWYATATPEGGPPPPPDVQRDHGRGPARWALVSHDPVWSEFDSRLRPPVDVPPGVRTADKDRVLIGWSIPLRYGAIRTGATGHIAFTPVRGGLVVAVIRQPVAVTALQGELPGLFLRAPAGEEVVVQGSDGRPFLRFAGGTVQANTASTSWRSDQQARGRGVQGSGWLIVARGQTYSWLDPRLRYGRDQPPAAELGTRHVVERWMIPVALAGRADEIVGTVTWVPRGQGLALVRPPTNHETGGLLWWAIALALAVLVTVVWRVRGQVPRQRERR